MNTMRKVSLLLTVILLMFSPILSAQQSSFPSMIGVGQHLKFVHVSTEQGLSHNSVYAMLQDQKGFLWFGTYVGLNRSGLTQNLSPNPSPKERGNSRSPLHSGRGQGWGLRICVSPVYDSEETKPIFSAMENAEEQSVTSEKRWSDQLAAVPME